MIRHAPLAQPSGSPATYPLRTKSLRNHIVPLRRLRSGLTLLEILLAAAILAVALAVLAQQNAVGIQAALRSQLETEAALKCQSLLNQLIAEGGPPADIVDQPFRQNPRWRWSARTVPSDFPGLRLLTITVYQDGPNRRISTQHLSRLVHAAPKEQAS